MAQRSILWPSTVAASPDIANIHHRMPLILPPDRFAAWIGGDDGIRADGRQPLEVARALLTPARYSGLQATAVSSRVNAVRNDDASLLEAQDTGRTPHADLPRKDEAASKPTSGTQMQLFGRD